MSWRDPSPFERELLADTESRWPEIVPLARVLTLAPRIEPLLLRNARERFTPNLSAEAESLLWFSPLVSARSTEEIVLHLGLVKALAAPLLQGVSDRPDLNTVWAFTRLHTRHWSAEDRLERDLRYYALCDRTDRLRDGLKELLGLLAAEASESKRIEWSRLVKRTLPVIAPEGEASAEAQLLAHYAALALGDAGPWAVTEQERRLPEWLETQLPPPLANASLGIALHYDGRSGKVLHFVEAERGADHLSFPSPPPARLRIAADGQPGQWHSVTVDSRIKVPAETERLVLTTLDGRQWELRSEPLPAGATETGGTKQAAARLVLSYVPDDREQAEAITAWLRERGMAVELLPESEDTAKPPAQTGDAKVVRLWTRAARRFWLGRPVTQRAAMEDSLLLRIEPAELPVSTEGVTLTTIDWVDWQSLIDSPDADALLDRLRRWSEAMPAETQAKPEATDTQPETDAIDRAAEIQALLKEIEDPATEPPRRLEIGDRLAELGDPRPGVGVREIEVPLEAEAARAPAEPGATAPEAAKYPEAIRKLLEEINDAATEPPRRLEIGDELDRLGDPRQGVGVDDKGLPDIDWVEIPAGAFIYQDGETRELPTFWISRYPITNRQYQAFIDAGGYGEPQGVVSKVQQRVGSKARAQGQWWRDLKQPQPAQSTWPQSNRPRTDVDWYEAMAFSRWLSVQLTGEEGAVRLPAEEEWEKAARGVKGLMYPWGEAYQSGYANLDEKTEESGPWYLEQTTAVGLYPHGRSPYQVQDLAGTVWEWCLNKYDKPEAIEADTSGDSRVLRGGSWFYDPDSARADARHGDLPEYRRILRGFRVVSSVPMPGR